MKTYTCIKNKKTVEVRREDTSIELLTYTTYSTHTTFSKEKHSYDNSHLCNIALEKTLNTFTTKGFMIDGQESPIPMALKPAKFNEIKYPVMLQRKYNGIRCVATLQDDEVVLTSRYNKVFNLPHISNAVKQIFNVLNINKLDGELYIHNEFLSNINSKVVTGDSNLELSYVLFDVPVQGVEFYKRSNYLKFIDSLAIPFINVDAGTLCETKDEVSEYYRTSLEDGYEGSIVCKLDGLYTSGTRTDAKSKLKPTHTDEFKCIDHYFNKGEYKNQSTLICETKSGKQFHVKMKGTTAMREEFAKNFETQFKNKMVTVEYFELSKNGIPTQPRGLAVRDYE